ncbi:DUF4954 domain-containing protein [Solitalea longa]|uniref:DUF4954 domain-containing protein n=1 Tax=Solitalea longa TaxID=2079460 RepID=A0A2S5A156_9SPHI|nr:DUF4954 family protein [Solitalea longa]POY35992.1 DUF4954 domain-containing protein [Solitalea longa]
MALIKRDSMLQLGHNFISGAQIPDGKDEYYIRFQQSGTKKYRQLRRDEIQLLQANNNLSDEWTNIWVTDKFNPSYVRNCNFYGLIRIGDLEEYFLEYHDMRYPVGLYNSTIVSCDLGNNVSLNNVNYVSHYIIGNESILFNVNELQVSNHSKFGNGIIKEGEDESIRIWLEVCNENGGRKILPFDGMLTSDAFLWSKYRDDEELMQKFIELTQHQFPLVRGYYGTIGEQCVIKNCQIIKDVKVGDGAYIKGANKLKNLTINSNFESCTQIGEGVELVNGIIGYGCKIFYGVKAVRFSLGNNSSLKYGARLINSILGENSTISCCEVLNCLIYPGHEQHHNNSFLIAATVLGQSNIAAGATIGSNHNSRANDGEIVAGRGFWPGLCVSLKHNSKFASFTLLAKGSYPAELNIILPFSLVSVNERDHVLQIIPAYWWMYNMYALARNSWKYLARDARIVKYQEFEFDYLAPDTIEEIFNAMEQLEIWTGADQTRKKELNGLAGKPLKEIGRSVITNHSKKLNQIEILGGIIEANSRKSIILKPGEAYDSYREMIHYFAIKTLIQYARTHKLSTLQQITARLGETKRCKWINLGGQLVAEHDLVELKNKIKDGSLSSWNKIHDHYNYLQRFYEQRKAEYAFAALKELHQVQSLYEIENLWNNWLDWAIEIAAKVKDRTFDSRNKDYISEFRKLPYDNDKEMEMVVGSINDNEFIKTVQNNYLKFLEQVAQYKIAVNAL